MKQAGVRRGAALAGAAVVLATIAMALVFRIQEARAKAAHLEEESKTRLAKLRAPGVEQGPRERSLLATAAKASESTPRAVHSASLGQVPFSGELRPASEAELAFKVGGRLHKILVKPGEWVREGQALLQLEDREAQAQLKQARAGVQAAQAQTSMAQDSEKRMGTLGPKGAVSEQQLLATGDQARLARAGLAQAEALAELAEMNLSHHTLRAPFSGRITRVPSGVGVMMAPGLPVMGVVDSSRWKIQATATLDDGAALNQGLAVRFSVRGLGDGVVSHVSPLLQERSRRVQFEIVAMPEPKASLFGGMLVSGHVLVGEEGEKKVEKKEQRSP